MKVRQQLAAIFVFIQFGPGRFAKRSLAPAHNPRPSFARAFSRARIQYRSKAPVLGTGHGAVCEANPLLEQQNGAQYRPSGDIAPQCEALLAARTTIMGAQLLAIARDERTIRGEYSPEGAIFAAMRSIARIFTIKPEEREALRRS